MAHLRWEAGTPFKLHVCAQDATAVESLGSYHLHDVVHHLHDVGAR